jgi:hypothetical protein
LHKRFKIPLKKGFLTAKNAKGAKFFKGYLQIVDVLDEIAQDSQLSLNFSWRSLRPLRFN